MPVTVLAHVLAAALTLAALAPLCAAVLRLRRDIAALRRELAHERAHRIAAELPPEPRRPPAPREPRAGLRLITGGGGRPAPAPGHHHGPAAS
ncbi:hypothetical protein [Streptomyces aidingensis]|uniref:Uncharacterized protein n=1 Tax=Streptomyces aidingensis TaxID=910347 RepID=A0A1I1HCA8_9ACTN|nr:hypothetical protein [Streptomyces aidingensis]SFC21426.1 hypothetical protein SAMN05421773_102329 [Streptomyces aidingensis]